MRTAIIFALVQFLLAVTWTLYVAFLPQLAAQAGIAKEQVSWILLMDQAIFVAMDFALGIAADRVANAMQRLGGWILAVTLASCAAFTLLPRAASPILLLGLTAAWAATSSVLHAPPMVMIARRIKASGSRFLVTASFLGWGIAGALAPILTARLRGISPMLPFIIASAGLAVTVAALNRAEQAPAPHAGDEKLATASRVRLRSLWLFFAAVATLALGFQVHTALNSAPAYLRFASSADLVYLMPVFWIGFAVCILLPDTAIFKRFPEHAILLTATVLGALALSGFAAAASFAGVLAAQFAAGGIWGVIIGTAANAAIAAGRVGREGSFIGLVFALSALAAYTRIAIAASGAAPRIASLLLWLPPIAWAAAAMLLALFVAQNLGHFAERMQAVRSAADSGSLG